MEILVNRLRQEGHEAVAVSTSLGICAAVLAAVCISAAPAHGAASGKPGVTLVHDERGSFSPVRTEVTSALTAVTVREASMRATPYETHQQVFGPRGQQGRGTRAFLRAIQTIFHLARTACIAMAERFSLAAAPRLRTRASVSLASRVALTVRAGGSDAL